MQGYAPGRGRPSIPSAGYGFIEQMNNPFLRPFRHGPGVTDRRVPIFDVLHAVHKAEEERFYVHCASNTNPFTPPGSVRPHVTLLTSDNLMVSALVDSGAQICMGKSSLLTRTSCLSKVGAPIPVMD